MANVLAIDGPAGAGCSTLANTIEREMGLPKIPTGLCYRGLSVALLREQGDPRELEARAVTEYMRRNIGRFALGTAGIKLDDEDITSECRSDPHHAGSSIVSQIPEVRREFTEPLVSKLASSSDEELVISEGRDEYFLWRDRMNGLAFGVYVTAATEIRAQRWLDNANNLNLKEDKQHDNLHSAMIDLMERDLRDASRDISPMRPAADALLVTDSTSHEQIAEQLLNQGQLLIDSGLRSIEQVFVIVSNGIGVWRTYQSEQERIR